jgi:hypothetical protein
MGQHNKTVRTVLLVVVVTGDAGHFLSYRADVGKVVVLKQRYWVLRRL